MRSDVTLRVSDRGSFEDAGGERSAATMHSSLKRREGGVWGGMGGETLQGEGWWTCSHMLRRARGGAGCLYCAGCQNMRAASRACRRGRGVVPLRPQVQLLTRGLLPGCGGFSAGNISGDNGRSWLPRATLRRRLRAAASARERRVRTAKCAPSSGGSSAEALSLECCRLGAWSMVSNAATGA
jgi:hypothetical protein